MRQAMLAKRTEVWQRVQEFLELSAAEHGVKWGGVKGNTSLFSLDGLSMVKIAIGEHKAVNEGIQSAKALVDECLGDWAKRDGVPSEVQTIISEFFRVNQEGKIDFNLLYKMKRWNIADPKWKLAMQAIDSSIEVIGSSRYLRYYTRKTTDAKWELLDMDFSKLN